MAHQLNCPCGEMISALDEAFVEAVQEHLRVAHPGRTYSENEIMMLAMWVPDPQEGRRSSGPTAAGLLDRAE